MKYIALGITALLVMSACGSRAWADFEQKRALGHHEVARGDYHPREVLVKFRSNFTQADKEKFAAQVSAAVVSSRAEAQASFHNHFKTKSRQTLLGWDVLTLPAGMSVEQALREMAPNALVEDIQPNFLVHGAALSTTYTPQPAVNEPYYKDGKTLWWFNRIKADYAWQNIGGVVFNGTNVIVAVLDTGVTLAHPEFSGGRLVAGYNVITPVATANDDNMWEGAEVQEGHGTHVAGLIVANLNGAGIAGTAFRSEVKVMPVKVLDYTNSGTISDVATGINWAATNGADIINMSFGVYNDRTYTPYNTFPVMKTACDNAVNVNGCLVISAAGNNSIDINPSGVFAYYPACYANVYAVGATNSMDHDTSYTNYDSSRTQIDFAAPGGELYDVPPLSPTYFRDFGVTSTAMGNTYSALSGTSFSTPMVAALAALLKLQVPSRTNLEIINTIKSTCENPLGLDPGVIGAGRINVWGALSVYHTPTATPSITRTATISPTPTISPTGTITRTPTVSATVTCSPTVTPTWHGIKDLGGDSLIAFPNPAHSGATLAFITTGSGQAEFRIYNSAYQLVAHFTRNLPVAGPHLEPWSVADLAPGIYLCRLMFTADDGQKKNYPIAKLMVLK